MKNPVVSVIELPQYLASLVEKISVYTIGHMMMACIKVGKSITVPKKEVLA